MPMPVVSAKKFSIDEYQQLADMGFFEKDGNRIELIRGDIVHMAAKGVAHEMCITELIEELAGCLKGVATVRCQSPITFTPDSAPEPDFTIVKKRMDRYVMGHPKPDDVLLLIEVSDSSITYDQTLKLSLYAEYGIADYWIFNLLDAVLECYRKPYQDPKGKWAYRSKQIYLPTDIVTIPNVEGDRTISIAMAFPPQR